MTVQILRIMTVILSLASVPAILANLNHLSREKAEHSKFKVGLIAISILALVAAIFTAALSMVLYLGIDLNEAFGFPVSQSIFNTRNILNALERLMLNWGMFIAIKHISPK